MNVNLVFGKTPAGQEITMMQVGIGPIDTRDLSRQIKAQQPEAWREVNYEIVKASAGAVIQDRD